MRRYLIDSSGLWLMLRDDTVRSAWSEVIAAGVVASCGPQRAEFRRSARNLDDYEEMGDMFGAQYPDLSVPKDAWRWVEAAQYRLVRAGGHRALSAIDLVICATAALRGLVILHDDNDVATAARHLSDLAAHHVLDVPTLP